MEKPRLIPVPENLPPPRPMPPIPAPRLIPPVPMAVPAPKPIPPVPAPRLIPPVPAPRLIAPKLITTTAVSVTSRSDYFLSNGKRIETTSWDPSGKYIDSQSGETFLLPNHVDFSHFINDKFMPRPPVDARAPLPHQQFVIDYMKPGNPYRGLLLNHNLGSGKTRTAIETAKNYADLGHRVLILIPATLHPTWTAEIDKWQPGLQKMCDFVHYNAPNAINVLDNLIAREIRGVGPSNHLKHRLIIADEVHNLISMIVSPVSKKGPELFDLLLKRTYDCKFLFLSATPILNNPFELAQICNLIRGQMLTAKVCTLFPTDEEEFLDLFINEEGNVGNPNLFLRRIQGMVSYYYGAKSDKYPQLVSCQPIEVQMNPNQEGVYRANLAVEEEERRRSRQQQMVRPRDEVSTTFNVKTRQNCNFVFPPSIKRPTPKYFNMSIDSALSVNPTSWTTDQRAQMKLLFTNPETNRVDDAEYRLFERQFVNARHSDRLALIGDIISKRFGEGSADYQMFKDIYNPDLSAFEEAVNKSTSYEETIDIVIKALKSLPNLYDVIVEGGPKMYALLNAINMYPGNWGPVLVYSNFVALEGIQIFSILLDHMGYHPLPYETLKSETGYKRQLTSIYGENARFYVIYTGEITNDQRRKILDVFNHPENIDGSICKIFLASSAAAEGISLKCTSQVHIMEPYWNEVRIQQVIGRARRIESHVALPKDKQVVYVYRYHMVTKEGEPTTDHAVFEVAKRKERLSQQFLQLIKNGAVDNIINFKHNNVPGENEIEIYQIPHSTEATRTDIAYPACITDDKLDTVTRRETRQVEIYSIVPVDIPGKNLVGVVKPPNDQMVTVKGRLKQGGDVYTGVALFDADSARQGHLELESVLLEVKGKKVNVPVAKFFEHHLDM